MIPFGQRVRCRIIRKSRALSTDGTDDLTKNNLAGTNGSVTPVPFYYEVPDGFYAANLVVRITVRAAGTSMDAGEFAAATGLSNGLSIAYGSRASYAASTVLLDSMINNLNIAQFASNGAELDYRFATTSFYTAIFPLSGVMLGAGESVIVWNRDNLTGPPAGLASAPLRLDYDEVPL